MRKFNGFFVLSLVCSILSGKSFAQELTLPPSGDNQKCSVTQWIGPVSVNITYNSPNVTGPNGEDRRGKIWGELVPYGMAENNFGTARKMPWRAGANENTTIAFSHDVSVEGEPIKAGTYGLFMIPGEESWTIIFSRNASSWGSFFYDEKEDVLRVTVKPAQCPFTEWLTYDFIDKEPTYAIAALKWEELMVPFKIQADVNKYYLAKMRDDLRGSAGFSWQNWIQAVNFCVQNNLNLEEALQWADYAINAPFVGEKNFRTMQAKASVLMKQGNLEDADKIMAEAMELPTADMTKIHYYGRQLIDMGRPEKAMEIFDYNRKKHPYDNFTTYVGLARGYAANNKPKQAVKYYRLAAENAPAGQRSYYEGLANQMESK